MILLFLFLISYSNAQQVLQHLSFDKNIFEEKIWSYDEMNRKYTHPLGHYLTIKDFSANETKALQIIKNKQNQLLMLYTPQKAAYSGMITKSITCIQNVKIPLLVNNEKNEIYWFAELSATASGQYGSCGSAEEPFLSQELVLFCKEQKKIYDIKYFQLKTKNAELTHHSIAHCKK